MFFIIPFAKAQTYENSTYLDGYLKVCKKKQAVYIGKSLYENGLFKMDCYTIDGNVLKESIHYTDSKMKTMQGISQIYFKDRKIYVEENYLNGIKNGVWKKWCAGGELIDSTVYTNGKKDFQSEWFYIEHHLMGNVITDSINNTSFFNDLDSTGQIEYEVMFKGEHGIMKIYNGSGIETDTFFSRKDKDDDIANEEHKEWKQYLEKSLNAAVPIDNGAPAGEYRVTVNFLVLKDGTISNVEAQTNFGYGMEKEAERVITKSHNWNPLSIYGHSMTSLVRCQPVTFLVE